MKNYRTSLLLILAIMAAYWAYTVIDSLIREFSKLITFLDLGVIFVLGLISGIALGFTFVFRRG
jgi:hypothetical protein